MNTATIPPTDPLQLNLPRSAAFLSAAEAKQFDRVVRVGGQVDAAQRKVDALRAQYRDLHDDLVQMPGYATWTRACDAETERWNEARLQAAKQAVSATA